MNSSSNIFVVKKVTFDQGERDPFGFDDFAEKLGAKYLPFSGSVSKPAYFLFVAYINHILIGHKISYNNERQRREIQIRLEKLLVFCWKKKTTHQNELRGFSILGNSFSKDNIDIYSSKGWIKQNVYKIYTNKTFIPQTLNRYLEIIGNKEIPILKEFIETKFSTYQREKKTDELLKALQKKNSLFNSHILGIELKKKFKDELLENIEKLGNNYHYSLVKPFFKTLNENDIYESLLENEKLPFYYLNEWFSAFTKAVNADIINETLVNRNKLWEKANIAFANIRDDMKSKFKLEKKPKPKMWFELKDNKYSFPESFNKHRKEKITLLWDLYMQRQGEDSNKKYFFNFRHYALFRLLRELQ